MGRVGNYVFNRIGYHVGFLTCGRTTSRRVDLVHTGPDLPETFRLFKGRLVINIQAKVAVFYGKVDQKRDGPKIGIGGSLAARLLVVRPHVRKPTW